MFLFPAQIIPRNTTDKQRNTVTQLVTKSMAYGTRRFNATFTRAL